MRKSRFLPALFLMIFVPAFLSCSDRKFNLPVKTLVITDGERFETAVSAELAVKEEERNYGFMNRRTIPDGTGMLFVFEKDQVLSFWMKNTPHPLSIAYIDSSGKIVDLRDMTPFSEASIVSSRSVRYALEVPQGWFKKEGVVTGCTVSIVSENGEHLPLKTLSK